MIERATLQRPLGVRCLRYLVHTKIALAQYRDANAKALRLATKLLVPRRMECLIACRFDNAPGYLTIWTGTDLPAGSVTMNGWQSSARAAALSSLNTCPPPAFRKSPNVILTRT